MDHEINRPFQITIGVRAMAQGNLSACLPVTLRYEGGKVDNPADPGGRTNQGVTQRTYDGYRRGRGLPTRDVYQMDAVERDDIYTNLYWKPAGCEKLAVGLDLCHFDGTVNSGRGNSARWLTKCGGSIHAYCAARLTSMHSFGAWVRFGKGWSARVAGVEAKAIVMMLSPAGAKTIIVTAGNAAAAKAKTASTIAHGAAVGAGAAATAIPSHPTLGILSALLGVAGAIWAAFHASTSGARAAVLSHESAAL